MVRFMLIAGIMLIVAGCGGSSTCSRACKHIQSCDPGASCTLSAECTALEKCQGKCITAASCEAIAGSDAPGAAALQSCISQCGTAPPPKTDGSVPYDGPVTHDGPVVFLDGSPDQAPCVPSCSGKQCGPNGCGGTCGTCGGGLTCNTSTGQCVSSCTPSCSGKQCGSDGCGGSCGTCGGGTQCNYSTFKCDPVCTPSCSGKQCGSDGCGGSCGTCTGGLTCSTAGQCVGTTPSNSGAICNVAQPTCPTGDTCMSFDSTATNGMCLASCTTPAASCPAPSGMLSICGLTVTGQTTYYCAYLCKFNGGTFACPNSYNYACTALDPNNPDISVCVPN